jgi:integrase
VGQGHDRSVGTIDGRVVHGVVSGIFRAAVRDRLIVANPCDGTRLPETTPSRVEPLPVETVHALADAVPARYRVLVILAAGSGMRQGECLGLSSTSCAAWCMWIDSS